MHILLAVLAFLCPIGIYCFFLASINQRSRPTLVSGRWDAIALLFALSGFFLITVPALIEEFYARYEVEIVSRFAYDPSWALWAAYCLGIVSVAWWILLLRRDLTMIYHVEPRLFPKAVEQAAANQGLAVHAQGDRLILAPSRSAPASTAFTEVAPVPLPAEGDRVAVLHVDAFPAMCHVTVRWEKCTRALRRDLERDLDRALVVATPDDNPAAGWFLSVSGMVFGALLLFVLTIIFMFLFRKL